MLMLLFKNMPSEVADADSPMQDRHRRLVVATR
jgi:hypothetical protein